LEFKKKLKHSSATAVHTAATNLITRYSPQRKFHKTNLRSSKNLL